MINVRMNAPTEPSSKNKLSPKIIVVGVGGAGCNAVNNMITTNVKGVNFLVCNTDAQALNGNLAEHKVQLGAILTEGLGAGAKPEIGRAAAEESLEDVMQYLEDANMAFITAGMGGGTGTGAASVIAKACRERGILTVGVVTKPFHFEGSRRMKMAEEGLSELQNYVDTLIIIPNQNLFRVVNDKTTFSEGFKMADSVLQSAVRGVTDLIVMPGLINLDFADIRSVMQEMGKAVMGAGEATGDNRAQEAAEKAISNPLLDDVSMKGAKGVIVNITGGYDMTLFEVDEACNRIRDEVDPDANIIFGSTFDETMEGTIRVSVVATGIESAEDAQKRTNHRQSGGGFQVDRTKPVAGSASRNSLRQSDAATMNAAQGRAASSMSESSQAPRMSAENAPKAVVPNYPATAPQTVPMNAYSQDRQMAMEEQTQRQAVGTEFAPAMNGAMKGMRVGDSYIPPQPADPHMIANGAVNDATIGAAQVGAQSIGQATGQPMSQAAPINQPSTQLNAQAHSQAHQASPYDYAGNPYAQVHAQAAPPQTMQGSAHGVATAEGYGYQYNGAPPSEPGIVGSLFHRITNGFRRNDSTPRASRQVPQPMSFGDASAPIPSAASQSAPGASGLQVPAGSERASRTAVTSQGVIGQGVMGQTMTGLRVPPRGQNSETSASVPNGAIAGSGALPAQGRLNIDAPAVSAQDDELEIPAFLRRQTS